MYIFLNKLHIQSKYLDFNKEIERGIKKKCERYIFVFIKNANMFERNMFNVYIFLQKNFLILYLSQIVVILTRKKFAYFIYTYLFIHLFIFTRKKL